MHLKKSSQKIASVAARLGIMAMLGIVMVGCVSKRDIIYLVDAARDSAMAVEAMKMRGIEVGDILGIYVESETPESALQFNQETNKIAVSGGVVMNPATSNVPGYLVNADGDIIFPVLGKMHVVGMTYTELAATIESRLIKEGHITDPVVTVKLLNFRVCVLGEVRTPKVLHSESNRMTIFEALGEAGDVTLYGKRSKVTVVREERGQRTIGTLDLSNDSVFQSPYYMLHQNDIVYVEPIRKRQRDATRNVEIVRYITATTSVVSLMVTIYYYRVLRGF